MIPLCDTLIDPSTKTCNCKKQYKHIKNKSMTYAEFQALAIETLHGKVSEAEVQQILTAAWKMRDQDFRNGFDAGVEAQKSNPFKETA